MVSLGFWQLRRLDERRDFNDVVESRVETPSVPLGDLLGEPGFDPDTAEWRATTASGVYLDEQILVFNRTQNGQAGDNVLTPLLLDGGGIVLVNRGFVPLGAAPRRHRRPPSTCSAGSARPSSASAAG